MKMIGECEIFQPIRSHLLPFVCKPETSQETNEFDSNWRLSYCSMSSRSVAQRFWKQTMKMIIMIVTMIMKKLEIEGMLT